jgi:hypothetical protein
MVMRSQASLYKQVRHPICTRSLHDPAGTVNAVSGNETLGISLYCAGRWSEINRQVTSGTKCITAL